MNQSSAPDFVHATIRICLLFRMFKTVFNKLHEHSHTGIKFTYNTFSQYYYIPFLEKWLSIFIHDCIECQRNKHFNMKIQTAPTQSFSEHAPSFNYRISSDTKGTNNPPSHNKSYIHVIFEDFSHFVVTVPIKSNNAKTAIKTLLHHWIIKFGPPIYLVTDRRSEYVNKEMAHLCTLMGIRHSPRTAYSPWTNGLVKVQKRNLGTHLGMFLHDTPKVWAFQVHMYAYAQNSHFQQSIFLLMNLFFTQDSEYPLPSIETLLGIPLKHVFHAIVLNFPNILIMTKRIFIRFSTEHSPNPFHNGFSVSKLQCYKYTPPYMEIS